MNKLKLVFWPASTIGKLLLLLYFGPAFAGHLIKNIASLTLNGRGLFIMTADLIAFSLFLIAPIAIIRGILIATGLMKSAGDKLLKPITNQWAKVDEIAQAHRPQGEILTTRLFAVSKTQPWMYLLGPMVALALERYVVVVTDKSYVFVQLNSLNMKPKTVTRFTFGEVGAPKLKMGLITGDVYFRLPSGQSLNLRVSKIKEVGLNDRVVAHFECRAA